MDMLDGEERVYESIDFANKTTTFQQLSVESYNQAIQFWEQFTICRRLHQACLPTDFA